MKSDDTRMRTQHGRGAKLLVRTELYDTERVVHMDRTAPPAGEPHSVLGYSVGRRKATCS